MPSIKQIIEKERQNPGKIYLYKEGIFYRAYNRSAYLWVRHICEYEVKTRFVKTVGGNVFYIGFPVTALETRLNGRYYNQCDDYVEVDAAGVDEVDYDNWTKTHMAVTERVEMPEPPAGQSGVEAIVEEIRNFPLESSTPIECVVFLSRLKKQCVR